MGENGRKTKQLTEAFRDHLLEDPTGKVSKMAVLQVK
jgi:hypothetical protein